MPLRRILLLTLSLSAFSSIVSGADEKKEKKEDKKPEPPSLILTMPLAVSPGITNTVKLQGNNLTNATDIQFTNGDLKAEVRIKSKSKVEVPKDADAKKVGDSQIVMELFFPSDTTSGTNWFIVFSTNGVSAPHPLIVLTAGEIVPEKEPNGGFKQAQLIELGKTVQGVIHESADVDVFRIEGTAGQRLRAEVHAARSGSALDSLMTLYDAGGHIIATNDDTAEGTDSSLVAKLPVSGTFFISVIDAQDRGGPTYVYLLRVQADK